MNQKLLVWFDEVDHEDVALVGGKGANLGEMTKAGFPVPPGFIITSTAYRQFLKENNLEQKITNLLAPIDYTNPTSLEKASKQIKKEIGKGKLSKEFVTMVFNAYFQLGGTLKNPLVAVRSSATNEDSASASFAGQQETFLNVQGEANLLLRIKAVWASLFDARAIFYRHEKGFGHFKIGIAVPIEKMIEASSSGIMFSIDPLTNNKSTIVIEAVYGLGEYIVGGKLTPDHYEVDKQTLSISQKSLARQKVMLIKKGASNKEQKVAVAKQNAQKITDEQILTLAQLAKKLEHHYYFPQDSEWAIADNTVYLVQTRPITTTNKNRNTMPGTPAPKTQPLLHGNPASVGVASGPVTIVHSLADIKKVQTGDVLVATQTNPDFVTAMKKAVAIVTDEGGRTSHAAIIARELGIPAVVGTQHATSLLKEGVVVTVNGSTGDVFKNGMLSQQPAASAPPQFHTVHTATKVYVNLGQPDLAGSIAKCQVDGIGLLRAEFMMATIGVHPKKIIQENRQKQYIETLANTIATFCQSFSPRPVVYRASDFKTNEYQQLQGGKTFEPTEPNPLLGYRGAYRYVHDPEVFAMEIEAIKRVRTTHDLKNVWLMLPFVRTVRELQEIKQQIASLGLYRSPTFKLWLMVEVPSNVVLLDEFIDTGIDGVSIGSNDLTMLMLGVDRDNSEVAPEYNEQNEALLWAYQHVIKTAHKHGISSSFCGQAPSQYPSLLAKLVSWGITSVSVSPDVIESTREEIARIEKKLTHG